jgi:heme a synthase
MNALRIYTRLLAVLVFFLILKGALVTSHDAGLSVPDWPTSYGYNMFTFPYSMWIGGIFFEHGHRLLATTVGALTLILAIWVWRTDTRRYVRLLALTALIAVILQGVLGGLTVLFGLPDAVSVSHAILGQTFFLVVLTIAYFHSREWTGMHSPSIDLHGKPLTRSGIWCVFFLYLQLLLGAMMRHSQSGLAVPDFPTMGGQLFPLFNDQMMSYINEWRAEHNLLPVTVGQAVLNILHRLGAILVLGSQAVFIRLLLKESNSLRPYGWVLTGTLILQIALGIVTILSVRNPWITSFHVLIGAAMLGITYLVSLRSGVRFASMIDAKS